MSAPARLAGFAAVLAVVFGAAALAGGAIDPNREESTASHSGGGHRPAADRAVTSSHNKHQPSAERHRVRGLGVADDGLRLVVDDSELGRGRTEALRFRVVDRRDRAVRDFEVEHDKRMHLIVVRRDLTGFQHLHPRMSDDGTWTTPLRLDAAGSYRLFADFARDGEPYTLAGDLRVDGSADLRDLPRPEPLAIGDGGYRVRLQSGRVRAGREAELRFAITRDGQPVHVEPYLGAGGHLVALREGDLAFLHVHPTGHGHDGGAGPRGQDHDDSVAFAATFPTAGRYRLFLQFRHEDRVRTVAFTLEARG